MTMAATAATLTGKYWWFGIGNACSGDARRLRDLKHPDIQYLIFREDEKIPGETFIGGLVRFHKDMHRGKVRKILGVMYAKKQSFPFEAGVTNLKKAGGGFIEVKGCKSADISKFFKKKL